jgi:hypothetical protein
MPTIAAEHKKRTRRRTVRPDADAQSQPEAVAGSPAGRHPSSPRFEQGEIGLDLSGPHATSDVKAGQQTAGPGITRVGAGLGLRSKTGAAGNGSRRGNRVVNRENHVWRNAPDGGSRLVYCSDQVS